MSPSTNCMIKTSDAFIATIAKCLSNAVGDEIKGDVRLNRLITQNSTPARIWDFINTNIRESFNTSEVIANITKRGAWQLVLIFDRETGTIYTLMRENRFISLKKELPKRRRVHYIDALVRSVNFDLKAPNSPIPLFLVNSDSEDLVQDTFQKILADLLVPNQLVKRHALILFQSSNYEISSLCCCIVDSNLNVVSEADWSKYLKASEGIIADLIPDRTAGFANPSSGLQYKQKAKDRINQKSNLKKKDSSNIQSDDIDG